MTFCPGKKQLSSVTGGWQRDLTIDLQAIRDWGARVLVTLMTSDELNAVGAPAAELIRQTRKLDIKWIAKECLCGRKNRQLAE